LKEEHKRFISLLMSSTIGASISGYTITSIPWGFKQIILNSVIYLPTYYTTNFSLFFKKHKNKMLLKLATPHMSIYISLF